MARAGLWWCSSFILYFYLPSHFSLNIDCESDAVMLGSYRGGQQHLFKDLYLHLDTATILLKVSRNSSRCWRIIYVAAAIYNSSERPCSLVECSQENSPKSSLTIIIYFWPPSPLFTSYIKGLIDSSSLEYGWACTIVRPYLLNNCFGGQRTTFSSWIRHSPARHRQHGNCPICKGRPVLQVHLDSTEKPD